MTLQSQRLSILCDDGVRLAADLWMPARPARGTVIINPATGVLARYYHRFARMLASEGICVLTYDYRGIGASRPARLAGAPYRWHEWGTLDFEAIVRTARRDLVRPLLVVGHSIGGALIGYAPGAAAIDRILTIGAQYAYWRDYAPRARPRMLWRWHVVMPAMAGLCGYFPGRRLGWLEDLPKGVALDWAFRRCRLEAGLDPARATELRTTFAAVAAPILALGFSDDPYGTPAALSRTLRYYEGSERRLVMLDPADVGAREVGHFAPFHGRMADCLWPGLLRWLCDETCVWPVRAHMPARRRLPGS